MSDNDLKRVVMPDRLVGCPCDPLPEPGQSHSVGCRAQRMPVDAALQIVAHGRAYTVEHFGFTQDGEYVGHAPANEYARAVDALVLYVAETRSVASRAVSGVHKPFTDDGVTYCGWDGHEGCGEVWPCRAITEGAET